LLAFSVLFAGCACLERYTPPGPWTDGEPEALGEVTACAGKFCIDPDTGEEMRALALRTPPDERVVRTALRREAAVVYDMPEEDVVLGEVTFEVFSSMVGNIRGWRATAPVARRK
jgi:hypothetical protein